MGQQPTTVNKVPLTDKNGHQLMDANHNPISTREYHYTRPDGSKIVIQEHSAGHSYGPPEIRVHTLIRENMILYQVQAQEMIAYPDYLNIILSQRGIKYVV